MDHLKQISSSWMSSLYYASFTADEKDNFAFLRPPFYKWRLPIFPWHQVIQSYGLFDLFACMSSQHWPLNPTYRRTVKHVFWKAHVVTLHFLWYIFSMYWKLFIFQSFDSRNSIIRTYGSTGLTTWLNNAIQCFHRLPRDLQNYSPFLYGRFNWCEMLLIL